MDINFHEQYRGYTTAELLRITMRPQLYQPAAVAAAQDLLGARAVTEADMQRAEMLCRDGEAAAAKKEAVAMSINRLAQLPDKWVYAILAIAAVHYLRVLYIDANLLYSTFSCNTCHFGFMSVFSYIDLVYLAAGCYMFYMRMRWGWILLFGAKVFAVLSSAVYYFNDYLDIRGAEMLPLFVIWMFVNVIILVLMQRKDVMSMYDIDDRARWLTIGGAALVLIRVLLPRMLP